MKKTIIFIIASFILTISQPSKADTFFEKIINDPVSQTVSSSVAAGWGDFNNDGFLDLIVTSFNDNCWTCIYPIQFYKNNGDGTFTRIYNNAIAQENVKSSSIALGDYNNDGWLDVFICGHLNSKNLLFRNNGDGSFTKITSGSIVNDVAWSQAASWADYDNDGWIDLFVANRDDQPNFLYRNNGDGTFTKITSGIIVNDIGASRSCAWADYDNDGWIDLFVANMDNQYDFLYKNNGGGTFTKIYNLPMVNTNLYSSNSSWNDFDNNGYLDLMVTYVHSSSIFYNFGNSNFQSQNTIFSNQNGSYGFAVADYDNDGYQDIFLTHNGSNNALYKNLNGSIFSKVSNEILSNEGGFSVTCAWSDISNNGKMDLVVANVNGNHKNYFYKNIGPTGNYLSFRLIGCNSNRSGIGAKITVYKDNYQSIRVVNGSGAMSLSSQWPHFGLRGISNVDSIIISWPSGIRQKFENIATNQFLNVNECTGIVSSQNNYSSMPSEFQLYQNYPNPFNPSTIIKFDLPEQSFINMKVFDINGRLIKILVNEQMSAGSHEIEFNSENFSSGTYFYKLESEGISLIKKMILLK
jgi:hypothetical protein